MPNHVFAPSSLPTPPGSPSPFGHGKFNNQHQHIFAQPPSPVASPRPSQHHQHHQQHQQSLPPQYVPVAPEDRIGTFLSSSLMLQSIIGTGAYGVVYEAVDTKTNIRYAVKALSKLNPDGTPLDARQVEYQTREIRLHYTASAHPNVVSMLKIIDAYPDCLYVVLEYCPEGDLFYNITECGQFVGKDELARKVFLQILDAVAYLHQSGIYHRDLKPENILVTDQGETLKLADFGLATASDRSEDYGCGSTFYMSPECLGQSSKRPFYYCAPNDVWSLGVILVNLTCGRNPWKQASVEDSTYRAYTRHPGFLKTILPLSDELDAILARIFTPNPDQRISLAELRMRILECPRFTQQQQPQPQEVPATIVVTQQPQQQQQPVVVCSSPVVSSDCAVDCAVFDYDDDNDVETNDDNDDVDEDLFENDIYASASESPLSSDSSDCETESDVMSCTADDCQLVDDDDDDSQDADLVNDNSNNAANTNNACQDMPLTPPPPMLAAHPPPANVADMMYSYEQHHDDASMMAMDLQQQQAVSFHQQQQQQQQYMFHAPPVYHQQMPDAFQQHQQHQHQQHVLASQMPMQHQHHHQQKPLPTMCVPQPTCAASAAAAAAAAAQNQPMAARLWGWTTKLQFFHQQINQMHPFQTHQVFLTGF